MKFVGLQTINYYLYYSFYDQRKKDNIREIKWRNRMDYKPITRPIYFCVLCQWYWR